MPYDAILADRVLAVLSDQLTLEQKRMFGGLAFMLRGNMACGVIGTDVIVRVPKDTYPGGADETPRA